MKTSEQRHWTRSYFFTVNFTYSTRYFSVSIVVFGQVNVCLEPVLWISTLEQNDVIALLYFLLTLNINHTIF